MVNASLYMLVLLAFLFLFQSWLALRNLLLQLTIDLT